ncbi:MAG: hypothetical protein IJK52_01760 [Oscillospiraceae bacterium]|nr:hypothetical protein [Oscillospiraceae bacterium]
MKLPRKKFWTALLCALCSAALTLTVWAAPDAKRSATAETARTASPGMENEDLLYGYLLQRAGASDRVSLMADAGSQLNAKDKELYDLLKVWVAKIASGEITSASYVIPCDDFPLVWDAEQLGVSAVTEIRGNTVYLTDEAKEAIGQKINERLSYDKTAIHHALLSDFPYELYWYDKTYEDGNDKAFGFAYEVSYGPTFENTLAFSEPLSITVTMRVSQDYRDGDSLTLKSGFHDRIETALATAKSIVSAYADKSDYDKLLGYSMEICNLVKYDHAAADDSTNTPYGDPWQLISVFDGDLNTNVVCEGYSKAFKYLCDLSSFSSPQVECHLVSGTLPQGTGAGEHMWNLVTMENGKTYLVDVTNSDSDNNPDPEYLLLKGGVPSSPDLQYTFYDRITFIYDDNTLNLWGAEFLTLDAADYKDAEPTTPSALQLGGYALSVSGEAVSAWHIRNGANIFVTKSDSQAESKVTLFLVVYDAQGRMDSFQQWDLDFSQSFPIISTQAAPSAASAKLIIVSENLTPLAASATLK